MLHGDECGKQMDLTNRKPSSPVSTTQCLVIDRDLSGL